MGIRTIGNSKNVIEGVWSVSRFTGNQGFQYREYE